MLETDILIVGAGPVGLALSIELGRRGVRTIIVEQNERVGVQPRAKTTNVRSMEHMRRWGIAQAIRKASPLPGDYPTDVIFATRLFGRPLAKFENAFCGDRRRDERFSEPMQWIPQSAVESVLRDHARTFASNDLRFRTRFEDFTESESGIIAELHDLALGERISVQARYLVGADGGRSKVRQLAGIEMRGEHAYAHNCNIIFRAPGLAAKNPQQPAIMYWLVNPDMPGVIGPMDQDDTWFLMMKLAPGEAAIDPAQARRMILSAIGREMDVEILVTDLWAAHNLIADNFQSGRVFLAGDACHLHPPYGGYGMNLGLGDAVDLGWKLAALARGWGGPNLLESYEAERRPIVQRVMNEAVENYATLPRDFITHQLDDNDAAAETMRHEVGARIMASKAREFWSLGVVLGYHYAGSPIVAPEAAAPPEDWSLEYRPLAYPGCLAPHLWLADGASLYDLFGDEFTLLVTDAGADDARDAIIRAASDAGLPLCVIAPNDSRLLSLYGAKLALIRPDQHVAWRGDALDRDARAIIDRLRGD